MDVFARSQMFDDNLLSDGVRPRVQKQLEVVIGQLSQTPYGADSHFFDGTVRGVLQAEAGCHEEASHAWVLFPLWHSGSGGCPAANTHSTHILCPLRSTVYLQHSSLGLEGHLTKEIRLLLPASRQLVPSKVPVSRQIRTVDVE